MNRRDFVTQLLSVPVGVALGATIREQARDNLARYLNSQIDTLVHRSLIHG